jgi:Domain of unknown function (DUF1906)
MLTVETAPLNTSEIVGFDTIAKLDAAAGSCLVDAGLRFCVRYVALGAPGSRDLDDVELDGLTGAGLAMMAVQYARTGGWSATTGRADGEAAARNALAAGFPPDATLWCDAEGAIPSTDVAIAYSTAWYEGATAGGCTELGIYVGAGFAPPVSEPQLFHALPFRRYWRSLSQVQNVGTRGYQVLQLFPGDQLIAGVRVDLDVVQSDYLGSRPRWAVKA